MTHVGPPKPRPEPPSGPDPVAMRAAIEAGLECVGVDASGHPVVGGAFELVQRTALVDLPTIIVVAEAAGARVSLTAFVADARFCGWTLDRTLEELRTVFTALHWFWFPELERMYRTVADDWETFTTPAQRDRLQRALARKAGHRAGRPDPMAQGARPTAPDAERTPDDDGESNGVTG